MLLLAIGLPRKESHTSSARNKQDLPVLYTSIKFLINLLGGGETATVITGLETVVVGGSVVVISNTKSVTNGAIFSYS